MKVGFETIKEVRNAASAEAKMSVDQPSRKAPPPLLTDLATRPRIRATKRIRKRARRSCASRSRMAPAESLRGPKAHAGQLSLRRNQPQTVSADVCLTIHSVTA